LVERILAGVAETAPRIAARLGAPRPGLRGAAAPEARSSSPPLLVAGAADLLALGRVAVHHLARPRVEDEEGDQGDIADDAVGCRVPTFGLVWVWSPPASRGHLLLCPVDGPGAGVEHHRSGSEHRGQKQDPGGMVRPQDGQVIASPPPCGCAGPPRWRRAGTSAHAPTSTDGRVPGYCWREPRRGTRGRGR